MDSAFAASLAHAHALLTGGSPTTAAAAPLASALQAHLASLPPPPALHPQARLEQRSTVSRAELRRLRAAASSGGCVTLTLATRQAAAAGEGEQEEEEEEEEDEEELEEGEGEDEPALSSEEGGSEDPSSDLQLQQLDGQLQGQAASAAAAGLQLLHVSTRLRASVAALHGYALVHAQYEDEVSLRLPQSPAAGSCVRVALDLPGPLPCTLTLQAGGAAAAPSAALACGAPRGVRWTPVPLPSGQPSAHVLGNFCAPTSASVSLCSSAQAAAADAAAAATIASASQLHAGDPLQLPLLRGAAAAATTTLRITRSYTWNAAREGHTLCVALPCHPASAPSHHPRAHVTSTAVQARVYDAATLGVASVVSPTHALRLRHCSASGASGAGLGALVELEPIVAGAGAGAMAAAAAGAAAPCLLLIEPGNLAQLWEGMLCAAPPSAASAGSAGLPSGLRAAVSACGPRSPGSAAAAAGAPAPPLPRLLPASLPRHVAVIMDGNGRWAAGQGRRRSEGHAAGVAAIHGLIRAFRRLRIPHLTLYAFSAQNWGRPAEEVRALMALLSDFVATDLAELCANGVRLLVNGDVARLPGGVRGGLARMVAASARNSALTLCLALSYGGREEIVGAAQSAARAARAGLLDVDSLTPDSFRGFLPHPGVPDPDLLVRTSGEMRVSNFLLWQIAYSEIHVTQALWPEFGEGELLAALLAYAQRERRFGKTAEQVAEEAAAAAAQAGAAGGDKQAVARLLAAAAPGQAEAGAAADAASSSSGGAGAMTAAQAADFVSSSAGKGRGGGSGAPAWVPEAALGVALWLAAARSGCCQRQPAQQQHPHRRRALRAPASASAQHSPASALRCLLCTLAPCVSLAVALLGLFLLAPLALRLGLLQSPGAGAGGAAWLGSGEPACAAAPLPPAAAAAAAATEPCVFVLIDAATCSGGKRLVGKAVGWALRLRDVLVPAGLR